jgi:hypothetical protein
LPRSYRLTEAFINTDVKNAFTQISQAFHTRPAAVPDESMTKDKRVLMFNLLSRLASALEVLLRSVRAGCPYILFGMLLDPALASIVSALKPCLLDTLVAQMQVKFPTAEALRSPLGQATIYI